MDTKVTELGRTRHQTRSTFKFLDPEQIAMIDEALHSLGDFGEVRLTVRKGQLRFLVTQRSFDALKWEPGNLGGLDGHTVE